MILEKEIQRQIEVMNFACEAHAALTYGDFPYVRHLAHVESVLLRFGFLDPDLLTAAWLHDAIEEADVSWKDIAGRFGDDVAALVFAVTDGEGKNRRERKAASYAKMIDLPKAIILKLADRIANVESSAVDNPSLLQMYKKEYPAFREKLFQPSIDSRNEKHGLRTANLWRYLHGLMTEQPST